MRFLVVGLILLGTCAPPEPVPQAHSASVVREQNLTLFDPDPAHLWNRLFSRLNTWAPAEGGSPQLFLDLPRWPGPIADLSSKSQRSASPLLAEFLSTGAEQQIRDPLARAVLQSNLLLLYEWAVAAKVDSLRSPLAAVLRRVALTPEEIRGLPDTYRCAVTSQSYPAAFDPSKPDDAFLPPDLLDRAGPWVIVGDGDVPNRKPIAQKHAAFFGGRSEFLVLVRAPGGREATIEYVNALIAHQKEADVPDPPAGTHFALLRRMLLLDASGQLRPTPIVESLQMRVFGAYPGGRTITGRNQRLFAFTLKREDLLRGRQGGLVAVSPQDEDVGQSIFLGTLTTSPGRSELPRSRVLDSCVVCHLRAGALESFQRVSVLDLPRSHLRRMEVGQEEERILADAEGRPAFKALKSDWKASEAR